jgi:hypothetical protein
MITIFNGCFLLTTGEVFTALSHTEKVLGMELELSDALEGYINDQDSKLKLLKEFSREVRQTVKLAAQESGSSYLGHPVNSYLMIKRFVNEWPAIEKIVKLQSTAEGELYFLRCIGCFSFIYDCLRESHTKYTSPCMSPVV